jgi:methionine-S-sulfoxide reductase
MEKRVIREQRDTANMWLSRRTFLKMLGLAGLGFAPVIDGCGLFTGDTQREERETMAYSCAETVLPRVIPPLDAVLPSRLETATFAMGCFWGPDARFGSIAGVVRTSVGYSGGMTKNPTYQSIGDHAETIQLDFDPALVSYGELLEVFWRGHDPSERSPSGQYRAAVFYHSEEQRGLAVRTRDRAAERVKGKIYTEILPFSRFYLAEGYHQKYYLQQDSILMRDFSLMYPLLDDFVASTAAARLNGLLGGCGTRAALDELLPVLGLSPQAGTRVRDILRAQGH